MVRTDSDRPRRPNLPSIAFDPMRRVVGSQLKASTARIIEHLEATERQLGTRQRRRGRDDLANFRLAAECMVANLSTALLLGPGVVLAVPKSSGVMWSQGRYKSPVYGQHFLDVLALMAHPSVALSEDVTRGCRWPSGYKAASTVRPTDAFRVAVCARSLEWGALGRDTAGEVIILRSDKDPETKASTALPYADNPHTRRMRKEVLAINAYLQAAPIVLLPAARQKQDPADPLRRSVVRIFNGSWLRGGRLYGAFWETMERQERFERIRIKGERIANVDFGQLFACLAYRRCHLPIPEGDLYDVAGDGSCRPGWKALVNALLFTQGKFSRWPSDVAAEFPKGTKLRDAVAAIREAHAPIAHLFGTGAGFGFMATESAILVAALLRLAKMGVPALPLHDSCLVAMSDAETAKAAMAEEFAFFTGTQARISIDLGL